MKDLSDHVCVVTGGSRGLGYAIAQALAEQGGRLVLVSRSQGDCTAAAARLSGTADVEAVGIGADVSDDAQVERMVQRILDLYGRIDVLVNAAGVIARGPIENASVEDFDQCFAVNVRGTWLMCRQVASTMKRAGYGRVINVASVQALVGVADRSIYGASKGAIAALTKALAIEWAPFGITVNAIAPGAFLSEMVEKAKDSPAFKQMLEREVPLKRPGELNEIAGLIQMLASPKSTYMVGSVISIDGGWAAH